MRIILSPLKIANLLLTSLNCQVDLVVDGKTAVQFAQQKEYDLIFMDIGLPDIDGFETTRRIRLQELNKGAHVPIIALTAHLDEENKQQCLGVGMNAVLAKPLSKEKAEDILNSFIPYRKKSLEPSLDNMENKINIPQAPIIDFDLAVKQVGGERTIVIEMLTMLIDSIPKEVLSLKQAYRNGDWKKIGDLVHKMKSGASYCGAVRLKNACLEMESAVKNGEIQQYQSLYDYLFDQFGFIESEFKTIRS